MPEVSSSPTNLVPPADRKTTLGAIQTTMDIASGVDILNRAKGHLEASQASLRQGLNLLAELSRLYHAGALAKRLVASGTTVSERCETGPRATSPTTETRLELL